MLETVLKKRLLLLGLTVTYYLTFLYSFLNIESKIFTELGFYRGEVPIQIGIIDFLLAILPVIWMPIDLKYPSQISYWLIYLFVGIPTTIVPHYCVQRPSEEIQILEFFVILQLFLLHLFYQYLSFTLPIGQKDRRKLISALLLGSCLMISFLAFRLKGFNIDISFEDVYERRFIARDIVQGGSLLAYAFALMSGSLYPLVFVIGICKKNLYFILSKDYL
jgi:hypothetical protein